MVSVLVFYSDNPSSNPGEGYSFSEKIVFKKTNINKKRPMLVDFLKKLQIKAHSHGVRIACAYTVGSCGA